MQRAANHQQKDEMGDKLAVELKRGILLAL